MFFSSHDYHYKWPTFTVFIATVIFGWCFGTLAHRNCSHKHTKCCDRPSAPQHLYPKKINIYSTSTTPIQNNEFAFYFYCWINRENIFIELRFCSLATSYDCVCFNVVVFVHGWHFDSLNCQSMWLGRYTSRTYCVACGLEKVLAKLVSCARSWNSVSRHGRVREWFR